MTSGGHLFHTRRERESRAGTMAASLGSGGPSLCFPRSGPRAMMSGQHCTKERGSVYSTLPFLTFPFRLWIRNGIVGELSSSKNSFSNIFFLRRSIARLCPLLAFCGGQNTDDFSYNQTSTSHSAARSTTSPCVLVMVFYFLQCMMF